MKKKSKKMNWKSWGVEALIPESVLERMVLIPGFDVNHVRKAAKSHLGRIATTYINKEIYKEMMELNLSCLDPDPSGDSVFSLGGILEYAFIVKQMEETLRNENGSSLESENLSTADADSIAELLEFRESLRAVKKKLELRRQKSLQ